MSGRISCGCDPDVAWVPWTIRPVCSDHSGPHHQSLGGLNEVEIGYLSSAFECVLVLTRDIHKNKLMLEFRITHSLFKHPLMMVSTTRYIIMHGHSWR